MAMKKPLGAAVVKCCNKIHSSSRRRKKTTNKVDIITKKTILSLKI